MRGRVTYRMRGDNVTRELGAAFLSPDFTKFVRCWRGMASLRRQSLPSMKCGFRQCQKGSEMEIVQRPKREASLACQDNWPTDTDANVKAGRVCFRRDISLFTVQPLRDYEDRFPPESSEITCRINGTATEFLLRNDMAICVTHHVHVFRPSGAGHSARDASVLHAKWCSPASLLAGGFGHDSHEYPLSCP